MHLWELGPKIAERRVELGMSQDLLARLAGVSRATINELEGETLEELGITKINSILGTLGTGLRLDKAKTTSGLAAAAITASVSYRTPLEPGVLKHALATGEMPNEFEPHIATLLEEAPIPIIVSAVRETAAKTNVEPKRIWKHVKRFADRLHLARASWQ